jgi:riboflavin kinase / FMN adenylyltransferase
VLNLSQNGCSVWVTSSTELALVPTAVALGKFDGVHRGHRQVIQPILEDIGKRESADIKTFSPSVPSSPLILIRKSFLPVNPVLC